MASEMVRTAGTPPDDDPVSRARNLLRRDRQEGLAALNALFRRGTVPNPPPDGPYRGELVAVDLAPGVSEVTEWLTSFLMPWKGKFLMATRARGDNIFGQRWRTFLGLMFPFYRGNHDYLPDRYRGFEFQTSIAPGMADVDRQVLRIDYDRPDNPALTIRRIVDEVTQVADGVYLGKIHFKWWWGRWQMIGYFALRK